MDPLLEHYMPTLMALKKALRGRQPGSCRRVILFLLSAIIKFKNKKNIEGNLKLFEKKSGSEKDEHC